MCVDIFHVKGVKFKYKNKNQIMLNRLDESLWAVQLITAN